MDWGTGGEDGGCGKDVLERRLFKTRRDKLTVFHFLREDQADVVGRVGPKERDEALGALETLGVEAVLVLTVDFGWFLAMADQVESWGRLGKMSDHLGRERFEPG